MVASRCLSERAERRVFAEAAQQQQPNAGEGAEAPAPQDPDEGGTPGPPGIAVVTGSLSVPAAGVPAVADHGLEVIWEQPLGVTRPGIGRYGGLRDGSSSPAMAERQMVVVVVHSGSQ